MIKADCTYRYKSHKLEDRQITILCYDIPFAIHVNLSHASSSIVSNFIKPSGYVIRDLEKSDVCHRGIRIRYFYIYVGEQLPSVT